MDNGNVRLFRPPLTPPRSALPLCSAKNLGGEGITSRYTSCALVGLRDTLASEVVGCSRRLLVGYDGADAVGLEVGDLATNDLPAEVLGTSLVDQRLCAVLQSPNEVLEGVFASVLDLCQVECDRLDVGLLMCGNDEVLREVLLFGGEVYIADSTASVLYRR